METITEELTEKEFLDYWAKINKQKSFSLSRRYVGLYKAMAISVTDSVIKEKQRAMMELIRQISNAYMKSGHILERWRLASDVMIPKKLNNCRIDSLRCIRLMEADLNQILKYIARVSMREMEKTGRFSDMHFGFWAKRTTYQAIMNINTMIDHAHQARVGLAISGTDCKSAFNCCIPEIIRLGLLSKGMPEISNISAQSSDEHGI